ncbi:fimbrial protein [Klebsiella sp. BIGb0407]|uniref:fimbrial protein n=1 Tax=Klebsiella sp. BIGb0407 TaxID=2940603 RepID=UPI002169B56D|nr:fimbrial protein [Klebsiella sp. BIGb0407]MCS3433635.1 hypothetical protein [Klebsiella sp. BIGb0407]
MEKRYWSVLLLLANLLVAARAATPVANIQVNGNIMPPTCTVNGAAESDIIFDLGAISPSLIPLSEPYIYPPNIRRNQVTVECDALTYLTFNAIDTYAASTLNFPPIVAANRQPLIFRLVDARDTTKSVGGIIYHWGNVKVDDRSAFISRANDINANAGGGNNLLVAGTTNGWTNTQQFKVALNELDLSLGKLFSLTFLTTSGVSSFPIFMISQQELADKEIDISDGLDFISEAVVIFKFGI